MKKMNKDFTVNANKVHGAIAEATQEPRKDRKTYTADEKSQYLAELKTAGRKGCKLPRINMAFTPENYNFIKTMSKASGLTLTEFINIVIDNYMKDHLEQYEKIIETRNSL